jgi:hypothetical protein
MHNPLEDPRPDDPILSLHAFARDLAYGVSVGLSSTEFGIIRFGSGQIAWYSTEGGGDLEFLEAKWQDKFPYPSLMVSFDYFEPLGKTTEGGTELYRLTSKAFALLEQPHPASIFISYRRGESSALALLLLARFRAMGQEPFLDLNIEPGNEWHAQLEQEVKNREYFVILIGPTTLDSEYVREEIAWALESKTRIIPIWHNRFGDATLTEMQARYANLASFFGKQAIKVEQENPVAYEGAITQLLNRFGMMV